MLNVLAVAKVLLNVLAFAKVLLIALAVAKVLLNVLAVAKVLLNVLAVAKVLLIVLAVAKVLLIVLAVAKVLLIGTMCQRGPNRSRRARSNWPDERMDHDQTVQGGNGIRRPLQWFILRALPKDYGRSRDI